MQAPQTPWLQPRLVPVNPSEERNTSSKVVAVVASTSCGSPFTFNVMGNFAGHG